MWTFCQILINFDKNICKNQRLQTHQRRNGSEHETVWPGTKDGSPEKFIWVFIKKGITWYRSVQSDRHDLDQTEPPLSAVCVCVWTRLWSCNRSREPTGLRKQRLRRKNSFTFRGTGEQIVPKPNNKIWVTWRQPLINTTKPKIISLHSAICVLINVVYRNKPLTETNIKHWVVGKSQCLYI